MISAVVLAKNEEKNIRRCLEGLKWCDEILVIDDDSDDRTVGIAERFGARVIKHSLSRDFAQQRNFGLEKARGEWVFFVDADERVSGKLTNEIQTLTRSNAVIQIGVNGFYLKRVDFFMGRWLKYGEIGKIRILRLARKDAGKWVRSVDEKWEVAGKTKVLTNPLLHYSHSSLTKFLTSINERSSLNAQEFYEEGKRITFGEWLKPLVKFVQNYFFRLGFLDGTAGFVFAVLMSLHSFMVRGKLYLLWQKKEAKNEIS